MKIYTDSRTARNGHTIAHQRFEVNMHVNKAVRCGVVFLLLSITNDAVAAPTPEPTDPVAVLESGFGALRAKFVAAMTLLFRLQNAWTAIIDAGDVLILVARGGDAEEIRSAIGAFESTLDAQQHNFVVGFIDYLALEGECGRFRDKLDGAVGGGDDALRRRLSAVRKDFDVLESDVLTMPHVKAMHNVFLKVRGHFEQMKADAERGKLDAEAVARYAALFRQDFEEGNAMIPPFQARYRKMQADLAKLAPDIEKAQLH